jgi:hypothetical protein
VILNFKAKSRLTAISVASLLLAGLLSGCATTENQGATTGENIAGKLQQPSDAAINSSVTADVQNAHVAAQTFAASNPSATDFSGVNFSTTEPTTKITVTGSPSTAYVITGVNSKTGFTSVFDSATGSFR